MLTATRNKSEHRFALQALVRGGGVRGPPNDEGPDWELWPGFHPLSECLTPPHKRFYPPINYLPLDTPKENPGALIVAKRNSSPSWSPQARALSAVPSLSPPFATHLPVPQNK